MFNQNEVNATFLCIIEYFNHQIKLVRCMNDALDVAFTQKDQPSLSLIISKCDPSTQKSIIERGKNLLAELRQKQN